MEEKTADEIAAIFSAAGDSLTVINTAKTEDETDDEEILEELPLEGFDDELDEIQQEEEEQLLDSFEGELDEELDEDELDDLKLKLDLIL